MILASVTHTGRGETDRLLAEFASVLLARNVCLAGVVQSNTDCPDDAACDMDLTVLPDGPLIRISQSLGGASKGCRLNPSELERAVGLVTPTLQGKPDLLPDLLIVNKFGKHEALGRGFRPVIAEALMLGIPVLTGVNAVNATAFAEFSGGEAIQVSPTLIALQDWFSQIPATVAG